MEYRESFGIIPLRKSGDSWEVLLIKHKSGYHWAFPKGGGEAGETSRQSAIRELKEETGLSVRQFLSDKELIETYEFQSRGQRIYKKVQYFLAEVDGELQLQKEEVSEGKWVLLQEAPNFVTFPEAKSLCQRAYKLLQSSF